MLQTLFTIPSELFGLPVFGVGLLLAAWLLASGALIGWSVWRNGWGGETLTHLPVLVIVALAIIFVLPHLVVGDGVPIRGYGVMMLVGVIAGVGLAMQRAQAARIDPEQILSLAFWLFAAGIAGARLFHVIEYWEDRYYQTKDGSFDAVATFKQVINIPAGGLVVYGSLIAGSIALVWFVRRNKLPGLALCDLIAPSMVLGLAFGRIGCLLNGCCFGGVCEPPLPWQVTFPQEAPPYGRQVEKGLLFGLQIGESDERVERETTDGVERFYRPRVDWVQPGSPAAEQGLTAGETIVAFNGH
ncbi:MAG: prolipoprotein diacylglyceryl transferase family protein, partial [Pirellulales bacterium]